MATDPVEPGVAERHDDGSVVRGEHVDARDVEPSFYLLSLRECGRRDVVPPDYVSGLHGLVGIGGQACLLREIEAEEQVAPEATGISIGSPAASSPGGMVNFSAPSKVR